MDHHKSLSKYMYYCQRTTEIHSFNKKYFSIDKQP